jgi:hypothetical protein
VISDALLVEASEDRHLRIRNRKQHNGPVPKPKGNIMTSEKTAHIKPSKHSTDEVDEFLNMVEDNVDDAPGAGSPAIMPITNLDVAGKPTTDTPKNPKI